MKHECQQRGMHSPGAADLSAACTVHAKLLAMLRRLHNQGGIEEISGGQAELEGLP